MQPNAPEPSEAGPHQPTPPPPLVASDPTGPEYLSGYDANAGGGLGQPLPSVPLTGYSVPYLHPPGFDPLVSPDAAGWWRRSMAIVRAGWMYLAVIQAMGAAVQVVVQVPLLLYIANQREQLIPAASSADAAPEPPDLAALFGFLGLSLIVAFVAIVIGAVVAIATMHIGVAIAAGGQPRLAPALLAAARRTFPLLGWQLVGGLIATVSLCACVLPILYFLAVLTLLPAVVAFERTNAIRRCFRLFHGSLGPAVGRIAAILGIGFGATIIASILSGVVGAATGASTGFAPTSAPAGASLAAIVVSALISAVIARGAGVLTGPLTLTAYADLRARIEPLTTQDLLAESGTPTTTYPGPAEN